MNWEEAKTEAKKMEQAIFIAVHEEVARDICYKLYKIIQAAEGEIAKSKMDVMAECALDALLCNGEDSMPLDPIERRSERATKAIEVITRLREHSNILVDAIAEIKATLDGDSSQNLKDIINGCIEEVNALKENSDE